VEENAELSNTLSTKTVEFVQTLRQNENQVPKSKSFFLLLTEVMK
jgi:hypothetical protein